MRGGGQALAAVVVLALVAGGGIYLEREVGPRPVRAGTPEIAPSGAWLCPHGGGPSGWETSLYVANPGSEPVPIRVQDLGRKTPSPPKTYSVPAGSELEIPVAADGRERASVVEYFGGWVAAGWVTHAGGGQGGVAAEPCLPRAGRKWLLPDGTTVRGEDAYVVVMNPFAVDAVLTVTVFRGRQAIQVKDWIRYVLPARRSVAFHLNTVALGERTVSAEIDVAVGRVGAASLGVTAAGGIRSAVGVPGSPPARTILAGGSDQGRTDLVLMNPSPNEANLEATLQEHDTRQVVGGLQEAAQAGESATTYTVLTEGPSTIDVRGAGEGATVAAVRRTYGVNSDQGSTGGVPGPSRAWVVLPAVAGQPNNPRMVIYNPGPEPAEVSLSFLLPEGGMPHAGLTVSVPAGRTVAVPREFLAARPTAAVLVLSSQGTVVPAAASYSLGKEGLATFAVAVGVPIPEGWIPA